jgi:HAD superfamily hydrolase (TIGR01509 family)
MFKAVLFDMDGVIVDTEPLHRKAYYQMFDAVNIEVSEALYASYTGQSTFNICESVIAHFKLHLGPQTLVDMKRDNFKTLFENDSSLQLLEGALELIKDYHRHGMTLVLASSASMNNINRIFERFDLNPYFVGKVSGADLKASKPDPEIFVKAAELSGHSKNECMVIEDSTNGINAAKAAEIFCIGYDALHSKDQDYSNADLVISNFDEISVKNLANLSLSRAV